MAPFETRNRSRSLSRSSSREHNIWRKSEVHNFLNCYSTLFCQMIALLCRISIPLHSTVLSLECPCVAHAWRILPGINLFSLLTLSIKLHCQLNPELTRGVYSRPSVRTEREALCTGFSYWGCKVSLATLITPLINLRLAFYSLAFPEHKFFTILII